MNTNYIQKILNFRIYLQISLTNNFNRCIQVPDSSTASSSKLPQEDSTCHWVFVDVAGRIVAFIFSLVDFIPLVFINSILRLVYFALAVSHNMLSSLVHITMILLHLFIYFTWKLKLLTKLSTPLYSTCNIKWS